MFTPRNCCNDRYTKFYLAEIKMDDNEFDMMLFLFLKLRKKGVKK